MNDTVIFIEPSGQEHNTGMCERNLNLLAHAQAIELAIGSRCGGHGVCGGDRIQILPENKRDALNEGSSSPLLSEVTEIEKKHLSPEEISQGWRLACQCFPEKSDSLIQFLMSAEI